MKTMFERDVETARIGVSLERAKVVAFLRAEADAARHAQGNAAVDHPDKLYRMGQKDGLLIAAEAIERGHHASQVDRSPEGQDPTEGLGRNDESAVPEGNAPVTSSESPIP